MQSCLDENRLGHPQELWFLTHGREKKASRVRTKLEFWEEELSPAPVRVIPGVTYLKTLEKLKATSRMCLSELLRLFPWAPL